MKMNKFNTNIFTVFFATIALVFSFGANAAIGLYNTGVDDSNVKLDAGAIDSHYTVDGGQAFSTNEAEGNPGVWLGLDTFSTWITPKLGAGNTASGDFPPNGIFTYQTSFDLTGIDFSLLSISGKVTADDGITDVLINGTSTGFTYLPGNNAFKNFAPFTVSSGFHDGINTLAFKVFNGGGPTGLRTEFDKISVTQAVPEPETYAMLVAGFGVMGVVARRRKSKVT